MSAVVPGLGLVYLRRWFRAVYWFGLALLAGSVGLPDSLLTTVGANQRTASAMLVGFVVAVSVVDTYRTALFDTESPAAADDSATARCEGCGRTTEVDLAFCQWCGKRFESADSATARGGRAGDDE